MCLSKVDIKTIQINLAFGILTLRNVQHVIFLKEPHCYILYESVSPDKSVIHFYLCIIGSVNWLLFH